MFNFDKTMEEVRADMQDDDVLLVDVREIDEFANGHIPDAINVPLSELDQSAEIMLPKDKNCMYTVVVDSVVLPQNVNY